MFVLPVRLGLGGSWLTDRLGTATPAFARVGSAVLSPAARDTAVALVVPIAALGVGFLANLLLLGHRPRPFHVDLPWPKFADTLAVWDSGWYFEIARRGYAFNPDGQSSIAFFPLYPLLMRLVAAPLGGSDAAVWAAGIAVSWTSFAAALLALHRFTEQLTGSRVIAGRTVLYLAIFPFSFYFLRIYTESLFLLWSVLAVWKAHESRWLLAGVFGALAALTRPNGVIVAVPLIVLAAHGRPAVGIFARRLLPLALMPVGIGLFCVYAYTISGDFLAWLTAQNHWGYSLGHLPHRHFVRIFSDIEARGLYAWLLRSDTAAIDLSYAVVALGFLAFVPAIIRTYGAALGLYVLVALAIPLSGNVLVGVGRYASVLFPVFIMAATRLSPGAHQPVLLVLALFHALFLVLFTGWYPLH